jgi:hypothetical protein
MASAISGPAITLKFNPLFTYQNYRFLVRFLEIRAFLIRLGGLMSQQWEYRAVQLENPRNEGTVNAELTSWAAKGWELVNASSSDGGPYRGSVWLFWRRAKSS